MNEFNESKHEFVRKKLGKKEFAVIVGFILIVILIFFFWQKLMHQDAGKVTTVSESSLKEIIEINDLSTLEYTYNGVKTVKDGDKEKYHVAYEGIVTAGIDITEIDIDVDDNEKKIIIILPEIEVQNVSVDMGTMEYIFLKKKYETETVTQEAYKACVDDLENKAKKEKTLHSMAKENAVSAMSALIEPWVKEIKDYEEYSVVIK